MKARIARWWFYFVVGFSIIGMVLSFSTFVIVSYGPMQGFLVDYLHLPPAFTSLIAWFLLAGLGLASLAIMIGYLKYKRTLLYRAEATIGTLANPYNTELISPVAIPLYEAVSHLARSHGDKPVADELDKTITRSKASMKKNELYGG